jgi:hypothetical protein
VDGLHVAKNDLILIKSGSKKSLYKVMSKVKGNNKRLVARKRLRIPIENGECPGTETGVKLRWCTAALKKGSGKVDV